MLKYFLKLLFYGSNLNNKNYELRNLYLNLLYIVNHYICYDLYLIHFQNNF